jgi:hypothetical protein
MSGAIPPPPNTSSLRGAQLKKAQGQLYLYVYLSLSSLYICRKFINISYTEMLKKIEMLIKQMFPTLYRALVTIWTYVVKGNENFIFIR